MRTYLKISSQHSARLTALSAKLLELCEKIDDQGEWTLCFPKGGNLMTLIQLLSKHGLEYEVKVLRGED